MPDPAAGTYEQLLTQALLGELERLDASLVRRSQLHPEEVADRIALQVAKLVRRGLSGVGGAQRRDAGLTLLREITELLLRHRLRAVDEGDRPVDADELLRAIGNYRPDGTVVFADFPATPLLDSSLLTNAPGEPNIHHQLASEIPSADGIDVLMAFVRRSGINRLREALGRHTGAGRRLRLLTTTYTGTTELAALEELVRLGARVRVSYETGSTRLHAKAWLFHRASGHSTAFIGSSNLTHQAQVTGLEWNVRLSAARNADILDKFQAVFDSYWESGDFVPFEREQFIERTQNVATGPRIYLSPVELRPEPFQARMLEQIALARLRGRHRNLLVSATGTGKTVMAALDYQRLRTELPRARLLFVAHRREILEQSLATFRHALRDPAFGESWVGGVRPVRFEHVFASIQSLDAAGLDHLTPDHFDVVIVDEFHHAQAPTYQRLLAHLQPRELLGLTATPERGDGKSIVHWFDDRIAAELRLWDAIQEQRLVPFDYYGVADGADYRGLAWTRGHGYEVRELEVLVTGNDVLARQVIRQLIEIVGEPERMRALGFCVSIGHAHFMAAQFNRAGIAAVAVSGATAAAERTAALAGLRAGEIKIVFSVDLFNEGVDLPEVDTLLLLRPTDSATLYIQQLGRGLRRSSGKALCTVLDFIGQHRKEYSFHRRFAALIGGGRSTIAAQIEQGFPFLPSGCSIQLDPVARQRVLDNIRNSVPTQWAAWVAELHAMAAVRPGTTLADFLAETGLELEDIYRNNRGWSQLCEQAGLPTASPGPHEETLRRGLGRMLHVDDPLRIQAWREFARADELPVDADLRQRRLLHMLAAILLEALRPAPATLDDALSLLRAHPQVLAELLELLDVLEPRIDHLQPLLASHPQVPVRVHARYSRREILAAFGDGVSFSSMLWQSGVRWERKENVDLFAITLDKTGDHFSPTTRYRDYAISRELLHWESQSTTRADSPTGWRYQQVRAKGPNFALPFVRLSKAERAFWLLGPVSYMKHAGERPMAITWQLEQPLPGDLFTEFAAAVA